MISVTWLEVFKFTTQLMKKTWEKNMNLTMNK